MQFAVGRDWVSAVGEVIVGEEDELLDAEDVEPLRTLPTPELPSRPEIEKHRIDHWPPRTWCDEYVEGFRREQKGHFHKPDTEVRSATISFDYMLLKKTGEYGQRGADTAFCPCCITKRR